ncbi:response regulator [uncultured Fusobacterium sp.]|uniref:response regulator n=1 Tax=uncultured Fusobacterium sp. TaxID=159267 RepID=UPI0025D3F571|nr:response regulator [uncultured Fusobacterium sp.]
MSNKILIIDDSEDILFAISEFFKLKDWEVFTALNVEEALKFLNSREKNIDIIIIDYNLPYINGIMGVKLIRQINPTVPIIALTIEGEEKIAEKFFEVGANDFAIKPIKVLDLYSRVNVHLKNSMKNKEDFNLEYRKGINENTILLIEEKLKNIKEYITVEEISEITGLAPKTTNRYMNYLVEIKKADMQIIYGKIGRPKNKYILKG